MGVIRLLTELISSPLDYPLWWLFFSWLIWLLLKWRNWSRPTVSLMLIFSISVGMFYIKSWQAFKACMGFELCAPSFSLFPFLAEVAFWFLVLYVPIAFEAQAVSEPIRRKWWIAFLILALATWYASVGAVNIVRSLEYFDMIGSKIFFYFVMMILLPWLFWFLLKFFRWPGPAFSTMFIYSIAVTNASFRPWMEIIVYRVVSEVNFSLLLFLAEIAMWLIALYVLMKLTLRIERQGAN